jgi:hypothetical protein
MGTCKIEHMRKSHTIENTRERVTKKKKVGDTKSEKGGQSVEDRRCILRKGRRNKIFLEENKKPV